jgi:hypothetical protein
LQERACGDRGPHGAAPAGDRELACVNGNGHNCPVTANVLIESLRRAETHADVIALANAYLGELDAAEIALLPERLRPRALHCALDVSSFAFDLVSCYGEETNASARLVNRLAVFFTQAAIRLSELLADVNPVGGSRRSA